jgi:L-2-hydroxyglutarate oxidase LhgO
VVGIETKGGEVVAITPQKEYQAQTLINCAGLHSDRMTKMAGSQPPAQIIPFRGEYFELKPEAEHLCNGLIYPVPDPKFPFLGVHFTRMIQGGVECGPNAVLAFAREGYHLTDVNLPDLWETLRYSGFRKLAAKHWRMGLGEMWRSASKSAFVRALQQLVPAIRAEHLVTAPAGIRAQVVLPDGGMMDDFAFVENGRVVNVVNAPSPAATSSLSIGKYIVDRLASQLT